MCIALHLCHSHLMNLNLNLVIVYVVSSRMCCRFVRCARLGVLRSSSTCVRLPSRHLVFSHCCNRTDSVDNRLSDWGLLAIVIASGGKRVPLDARRRAASFFGTERPQQHGHWSGALGQGNCRLSSATTEQPSRSSSRGRSFLCTSTASNYAGDG